MSLSREQIQAELARLDHGIPWTHHFDIDGLETISKEQNEQFYKKSHAAKVIGALALSYYRTFSDKHDMAGLRVLDIASAEGGHSITFAQAGAAEVIGIEGRPLYVERAEFVAKALGVTNVRFICGDVRRMKVEELGQFDLVICSGILHHLGADDFRGFLKTVGQLTADTLFLYTHVSNDESIKSFRLTGPHEIIPKTIGYLYREHADEATAAQKERQVRASLDNTFSFWATEETLVRTLTKVGFKMIAKAFLPHAFGSYTNRNIRVIFIAKKAIG